VVQASNTFQLNLSAEGSGSHSAQCPAGKKALGGGGAVTVSALPPTAATGALAQLSGSQPSPDGTAWTATFFYWHINSGEPQTATLQISAVCATVP